MRSVAVRTLLVLLAAAAIGTPSRLVARSQQAVASEQLDAAFAAYDKDDFRGVEAACGRITSVLQSLTTLDEVQLRQLITAYELRARARFNLKNATGAYEDFKAILTLSPGYAYGTYTAPVIGPGNPPSTALFDKVKTEVVGFFELVVTPDDAEVTLNGAAVSKDQRARWIPAVAGRSYRVSARKAGHQTREEDITVGPNLTAKIDLPLKRMSSTLTVITIPAGVEIVLDNVVKGKTRGPLPEHITRHRDVVAIQGTRENAGFYEILDVANGPHQIELRLDCYRSEKIPYPIDEAGDFPVAKKMTGSFGLLEVKGSAGVVYIDDVRKGPLPYTQELCPRSEPYAVEVRGDRGRYIERVRPVSGRTHTVAGVQKPAIAILSQVGLPADFRDDLRVVVETILKPAEGITFVAVPEEVALREMANVRVQQSWLHYDTRGRPVSDAAIAVRSTTRMEVSANLSRSLEVQGVAEIVAPLGPRDPNSLLLTVLAAGSSIPETIELRIDDQASRARALEWLNQRYTTSRISSGFQLADVDGAGGAVLLRQVWDTASGAKFARGDVFVSADGVKTPDASAFEAVIAGKKDSQRVSVQVRGAAGERTIEIVPRDFPKVVSYLDETLPINKLILDFRLAVQEERTPYWQSIARLNLAVVLMRAENWQAAKDELDKVVLPEIKEGEGIAPATVQFYLGLCLDQLGKSGEATKAFEAASRSPNALLTGDGPLVRVLAEEKLKDPNRRR